MKMNAMHQFAMSKFATSQSRDDAMLEEIDMLQGKVKDLSAVLNHHKTLKAENAALKAELAAAQKDAFRAGMLAAAEMERSKGK